MSGVLQRLLAALGLAAVFATAGAAASPDPIVGLWTASAPPAQIDVTGGATFSGTVRVAYSSQNGCVHPVGQVVWESVTRQADGTYKGINHGYVSGPPACPDQPQTVTFAIGSVSGGRLSMQVCNQAGFGCSTWTRPVAAAETKTYLWFVNASFSNPRAASLIASLVSGPIGSGNGEVKLAGDEQSGGVGAYIRINDTLKGGKKRVLSLRTVGLAGRFAPTAGGGGTLELQAQVLKSDYSNCAKGNRGIFLTLRDGAGRKADSLTFRGCGATRNYVNGRTGQRVNVTIGERR